MAAHQPIDPELLRDAFDTTHDNTAKNHFRELCGELREELSREVDGVDEEDLPVEISTAELVRRVTEDRDVVELALEQMGSGTGDILMPAGEGAWEVNKP